MKKRKGGGWALEELERKGDIQETRGGWNLRSDAVFGQGPHGPAGGCATRG